MTTPRICQPSDNPALHAKAARLWAEGGLDAVMDALTGKQRKYVEEYVKDFSEVDALLRAGFKPGTRSNAYKMASNVHGHPLVIMCIKELSKRRTQAVVVDVNYVLKTILKTINAMDPDLKNPKASAVSLRAAELLARHLGMFVERQELTGKDGGPIETREVQDDADAFARTIASLATRSGESGPPSESESGDTSKA